MHFGYAGMTNRSAGNGGIMRKLLNFTKIIDLHTLVVTVLAVASTYLCDRYDIAANMPTGLIGVAIVFPIVFTINAAYRRREEALRYFASLKAHAMALIYAHRDWSPKNPEEHFIRAQELMKRLFDAVTRYFQAEPDREEQAFRDVYEVFSAFSRSHEQLRQDGVPANEISRGNQYVRSMMIEFERMKNIQRYRTPVSLRAYSYVFLNVFPILFGPYFAYLIDSSNVFVGYMVAVIYSLVLVSLDNIQEALENPFDMHGADDVNLETGARYSGLLENH
jgi:predicted membrane chloride channel (bestrophin family)